MKKGEKDERRRRALAVLAELDGPAPVVRTVPERKSKSSQPPAKGKRKREVAEVVVVVAAVTAPEPVDEKRILEWGEREPVRVDEDGRPYAYYGTHINPADIPRKWDPGQLVRGDLVFYRGQRMWVEHAPRDWETSFMVHIGDHPVPPGPPNPDRPLPRGRIVHACHADCLLAAPQVKSVYGKLPTVASAARAERAKAGVRDVGDPIAVKLRPCKTLDDAYKVAAKFLGCPLVDLKDRYGRLNPGQQRMNLGNRMRNHWKKTGGKEL